MRGDTGAGVREFVWYMQTLGLHCSVGVYGRQPIVDALAVLPRQAWRNAREPDGRPRDGAQVAELTAWLPPTFHGWPPGTRIIARRERPHPGAQLHITDHEGWRITVFATSTGGRLVDLELRHRLRARAEDRIRGLKDTGLTNLPLQAFAKNQIWLELVQLATELLTWTQLLAWHHHPAQTWEPQPSPLGSPDTETAAAAVTDRCRTTNHHRGPAHPASFAPMALVRPDNQRPSPSCRPNLTQLPASSTRN